ncbi:MAG: Unknown protein [uncultured Campylobacterales bacterium]|uniref:Prepilin-type N-terminal cleavage/methylation domain-containing protein n=1 Tax=uncultured Campylobacterales bacterium TaxID=352960 RepID=A0A6S6TM01_9BACT|nr:MAG: Unknown protein [uncultured Campylobacterales bacterium]
MYIQGGKKAFTFIEIVFVIVILGLASSIGARVISNAYSGYIKSVNLNTLNSSLEVVVDQISKRLESRIKGSVIARNLAGDFLPLATSISTHNYTTIEWIGSFYEGLLGEDNISGFVVPNWSGFIDINSTSTNKSSKTIHSPLSKLTNINSMITNILGSDLSVDSTNKLGFIFRTNTKDFNSSWGWNYDDFNHSSVHIVNINSDEIFEFNDTTQIENIFERYDLSWSAYAISIEGDTDNFDLYLHYNYRPWLGERYTDGEKSILAKNVSTFRVYQGGSTIRLKVCLNDDNKTDVGSRVGFCKEKVIL